LAEIVTTSLATHRASNATSDTYALVELVVEGIAERYPDTRVKTDFRDREEWMWNNAGGAMGSMFIIHASITE
jgi:C-8 sterol isomerase